MKERIESIVGLEVEECKYDRRKERYIVVVRVKDLDEKM